MEPMLAKDKTDLTIIKDLNHDFTGHPGIQDEVIVISIKWFRRWL